MPFLPHHVARKYHQRGMDVDDQLRMFRARVARFAVLQAQRQRTLRMFIGTQRQMIARAGGGPQRAEDLVRELRRDPVFTAELLDLALAQLGELADCLRRAHDREAAAYRASLSPRERKELARAMRLR